MDHTIIIEPLPADPEAAKDFLRLQRETFIATYTGKPCLTQDGEPSLVAEVDMEAWFDPRDEQAVGSLVRMAETNFDPVRDLGCVLLRAVDLSQGQRRTVGALNLKFGTTPTPDKPASVTLHDIAIRPDSQRRGIGCLLLGVALTSILPRHEAGDPLKLIVLTSNEPAKAWYDKLEITPTGYIKKSEWGKGKKKVELEERSAPIGKLMEKVADLPLR